MESVHLVASPVTKQKRSIQYLSARLQQAGVTKPEEVIAGVDSHLSQIEMDELVFFAGQLVCRNRQKDFARLRLAVDLALKFSNIFPDYRERILFAIQFNLRVDSHAIPNVPFYEALINVSFYLYDVLEKIPSGRLHRNKAKIVLDVCRVYLASSRNINQRLQEFSSLKLDIDYLLPFLFDSNNIFLEILTIIRNNKLPERMVLFLPTCPAYVWKEFADPLYNGIDEREGVICTLCMYKSYPQFKSLQATGKSVVEIATQMELNVTVLRKLVKALKMVNYQFPIYKIFSSYEKSERWTVMGATPDEIPYIAKYDGVADEAMALFLKERKDGVLIINFDSFFTLYYAHAEIFKLYLKNFDESDLAQLIFYLNVNPSFLNFCLLQKLNKTNIDKLFRYNFHQASLVVLERLVKYKIPDRYWLHYISMYQIYGDGMEYADSLGIPLGQEYFEVASNYLEFKEIAHRYIGSHGNKLLLSQKQLRWLIRFAKSEPLKLGFLFQYNVAFNDLVLFFNVGLELIHEFANKHNTLTEFIEWQRGNAIDIIQHERDYHKECCYFNFFDCEKSIHEAFKFLNEIADNQQSLRSSFQQFIDKHNDVVWEESVILFLSDDKEDCAELRTEKMSQLRHYQSLEKKLLFNANIRLTDENFISLFPGQFESKFIENKNGPINFSYVHFNNTFGFIRFVMLNDKSFPGKTLLITEIQNDIPRINFSRKFMEKEGKRYAAIYHLFELAILDFAREHNCAYVGIVCSDFIISLYPAINHETAHKVYSSNPSFYNYTLYALPRTLTIENTSLDMVWLKELDYENIERYFTAVSPEIG